MKLGLLLGRILAAVLLGRILFAILNLRTNETPRVLQNGNGRDNTNGASATACRAQGSGKGKKCKFNSSGLNLQPHSTLTIAVEEGGRQIQCHHKPTGKNEKGWYVHRRARHGLLFITIIDSVR